MAEDTKTTLGDTTPVEPVKEDTEGGKTFSQEDMDTLAGKIRKETRDSVSKEVTETLTTQFEEKLKKELDERDRLAKMSSAEKEKELKERYEKDLSTREKEVAIKENRYNAMERFSKEKIPVELVDFVVEDDPEKTEQKIDSFIKIYNDSVAQGVAEKTKGTPPKDVTTDSSKGDKPKVKTSF